MSQKVLVNQDFGSVARIVGLLDPLAAQDVATKAYVDSTTEGLNWKDSVRVASVSNINLAAPGASIDGITMVALDRFLAKDSTAHQDDGIYVWNGAAVPATRSADMNSAAEVEQAIVAVEEGTNAGTTWRQSVVNVTLGTTPLSWTTFGVVAPPASTTVAGIIEIATQAEVNTGTVTNMAVTPETLTNWTGRIKKFAAAVGDTSATSYTVTHNLGTKDVQVAIYRNSTPWDTVFADVERDTTNSVVVKFAVAPTTNQYMVVVIG